MLSHATKAVIDDTTKGDVDALYDAAIAQAAG